MIIDTYLQIWKLITKSFEHFTRSFVMYRLPYLLRFWKKVLVLLLHQAINYQEKIGPPIDRTDRLHFQ